MRAPAYAETADAILAPDAIESPQTLYAELRATRPLARIGDSGVHTVATWALIDEALGREDDFSANLTGVLFRGPDGDPAIFPLATGGNAVIATADEPHHGVHRAIAQPRLDARRTATPEMEARVRTWARRAMAPWLEAGRGDVVPIAEVVPALAVAYLLGLPETDVADFRTWSMMGGDILAGEADGERLTFLATESANMGRYLGRHFDALEDPDPGKDAPLLNALARATQAGRISRAEAIGIAIVMFGAGGESTAALIGSALRRLAEDADLADRLRADPSLVLRFIEEVVRLDPPFNFHYRAVRRACTFGGYDLEEGDRLMLLWASANRDPAVHDDPDVLRLDRRHPKRHMGFGRGAHFCIGAPLARLEARVVVEEVLAATKTLAPEAPERGRPVWARYAKSIFIRRLEGLDLVAERV
ncbi:MAG: cytochrome P450 [Myxococcota bacterium]